MSSFEMRRVVITGIGAVSPLGVGWHDHWRAWLSGESRFTIVTRFNPSGYACQIAGQVDDSSYENLIDPRKARTTSHASRLALAAAELAVADAHLPVGHYPNHQFGVAVGTALGGWADGERQIGILLERGARRTNPFIISGAGPHGPGIEVASMFGAQGPYLTVSCGCPSSLLAIGQAVSLIASSSLEVCLVGGTESPITPSMFAALCRTNELSCEVDGALHASRPFDRSHAGMVLSEGSCFFVLETLEGARRRGASVYAELSGCVSSCDGQGMYSVDSSGEIAARAIHRLLAQSNFGLDEIDYVCAHANSTPAFDSKEAVVLNAAFGELLARIAVSSIKGVQGHPSGASGAFQIAASALTIQHRKIPPTRNLQEPAQDCQLQHIIGSPQDCDVRAALVTSYGYGGLNSCILVNHVH
jgi:3-oxoacyl-[acyl-carrier-protein] synthase II